MVWRPENGSAHHHDVAGHRIEIELNRVDRAIDQAVGAALNADDLPPVRSFRMVNDRADDRVKANSPAAQFFIGWCLYQKIKDLQPLTHK